MVFLLIHSVTFSLQKLMRKSQIPLILKNCSKLQWVTILSKMLLTQLFKGLFWLSILSILPIETKYVSSCCLFGSGSGSRFPWKNTYSLIVKSMRACITFSTYTRGFLPNLICEMKKEVLQHKSTYQKYILAIVIAGHTYTNLNIIHVMYWMALHVLNCIIWCTLHTCP